MAAAQKAFDGAGITPSVDTYEQDVKAVLTKVELGEVDAGLVYVTDVLVANDEVEGIEFERGRAGGQVPDRHRHRQQAAAAFMAFVLSDQGQAILAKYGFGAP